MTADRKQLLKEVTGLLRKAEAKVRAYRDRGGSVRTLYLESPTR